jgi:hypothetical protein
MVKNSDKFSEFSHCGDPGLLASPLTGRPKWQSAASAKKEEAAYQPMTAGPGIFRFLASLRF